MGWGYKQWIVSKLHCRILSTPFLPGPCLIYHGTSKAQRTLWKVPRTPKGPLPQSALDTCAQRKAVSWMRPNATNWRIQTRDFWMCHMGREGDWSRWLSSCTVSGWPITQKSVDFFLEPIWIRVMAFIPRKDYIIENQLGIEFTLFRDIS